MESMDTQAGVAARSRRYFDEQKKHAVRMVFALREELGTSAGRDSPALAVPGDPAVGASRFTGRVR